MPKTELPNPYPTTFKDGAGNVHEIPMSRLNAEIWTEDYNFIRRFRVERGTAQATINILWKKLCDELRYRNITSFADEVAFVDFVTECRFVLPSELHGGSATLTNDRREEQTVRTGPAGSSSENPRTAVKPSDVKGGDEPRQRRQRTKRNFE